MKSALFVFTACIAMCVCLSAQESGRVSGVVVDPAGAAIPNAKVDLRLQGSATAAFTTNTTSAGVFSFPSVRAATYDLRVEAPGFALASLAGVVVDAGRDTSIPAVKLEVGSVATTVEVGAHGETVETNNSELSTTITNQQVRRLPSINRDVQSLITTQPGVTSGSGDSVINGMRPSYVNVTLDGINIQDNFIRTNDLTYSPNLLLLDQVGEVTISTSNSNTAAGGGATQVNMITPSGTNAYHGQVYWTNRNSALAANTWFNDQQGVKKPFLNQNQLGATVGGHIIKDKLFFYANYEAFRLRQTASTNTTILSADARNGIYTYRDTSGNVQKVNILQAAGIPADPTVAKSLSLIPPASSINNYLVGDSTPSLLRNTAGYSYLQRSDRTRDNVTAKIDYNFSPKHVFTGSVIHSRDILDRPDVDTDYTFIPEVANADHVNFISAAWRWTPTGSLTNEFRGGYNIAPVIFLNPLTFPSYLLSGLVFTNPFNTFQTQGRNVNTYNFRDSASYTHGAHSISFGAQFSESTIEAFNAAGITPTYSLAAGAGHTGLTSTQLPGISSSDLTGANNLLAALGGLVDGYSQTFNVTSKTSGFVPGANNLRHYIIQNYAAYAQDTWRVSRRLTLNLGVRWDYVAPLKDADGLELLPTVNTIANLFNPTATLDFAGGGAGTRPMYNSDKKTFAPNLGIAWDVFGSSKTVFRAGYSINFVNDELGTAIIGQNNAGLASTASTTGLTYTATNAGAVPVPVLKVPRTVADNYALSNSNTFSAIDPNLRTPYVQQYSAGIQHDFKGTILEIRYVGNHGVKELRAIDYNQVNVYTGGFLQDFQRAQANGFLSQKAGLGFLPSYNPNLAGSQPLTVFPIMAKGGSLTNSTVLTDIQQGQVGTLAQFYQQNALNAPFNFFPNPNALVAKMLTNYSNSTYNSVQLDVHHRVNRGLYIQGNYVFSKVLSDAIGDSQGLSEPFLDINNAKLDRARSTFDLTHVLKANAIYDLPIGPGHALDFRPLARLLGGWSISGIWTYQSGTPFSILSARGTLNRGSSSTYNGANSALSGDQLDQAVYFRMTGNGPYMIAASAIGTDGRGVAADGSAPFSGQVFSNPAAGTLGALQRRMFNGPWDFNLNFAINKETKITERAKVEVRMESSNILNHPTFSIGDQNINNTNFGQITSTFFGRRLIQFDVYVKF